MYALSIALHALAAVLWVGGMLFAYVVLRPSAAALAPRDRLGLWRRVLGIFLPLALGSVLVLLVTGYLVLFGALGGFATAGVHVHLMQLTGWIMFLLFFHLFFVPWRRFKAAFDSGKLEIAGAQLQTIRLIVLINLVLGLLTVAVGASGRYW